MDNFNIIANEGDHFITLQNDADEVKIINVLTIEVSPYGEKDCVNITDHEGMEIELDANDLRQAVEAFIKLNNIK